MENADFKAEVQPETEEKAQAPERTAAVPDFAGEIFVPVKYNKEIKKLGLEEAARLAQKGLKFEAVAADYQNLKRIAARSGKSVSEFLRALEKDCRESRRKELLEKCGGNEEMADYVLRLEKEPESDMGLEELKEQFPEIKDISDLPRSVVENAEMKGTLLLDEYLRYRHGAKRESVRAAAQRISADNASVGPQTDRRGGLNPETAEFLKGLWK